MGTAEKLNYLLETKNAIKTALINKGATVNDETPFRDYAGVINGISTGGENDYNVPQEALELSGSFNYRFAYNNWNWFIELFGNDIITEDVRSCGHAFSSSTELEKIPFVINCNESSDNYDYMFYQCSKLKELPIIIGGKMYSMYYMFNGCQNLREIPHNFELWFSKWSLGYNNMSYMFRDCHSLRRFPVSFLRHCGANASSSYTYFNYGFKGCYVLDELLSLPMPYTAEYTYGNFAGTFDNCHRVKNITFETDNGIPLKKKWKFMHLRLDERVGYARSVDEITGYNSGITADKEVFDDITYQMLKNDPDWFTCKEEYSRYDKSSAINTIISLPDTSEYLLTAGGQNTIYFVGGSGSATEGGAINTMTEEEIAVAAAKGWTVSYK